MNLQEMTIDKNVKYKHRSLGELEVQVSGTFFESDEGIIVDHAQIKMTAWDEDDKEYHDTDRTRIINDDDWLLDVLSEHGEEKVDYDK